MDVRVGILLLFLLGANWRCDARQLEEPYFSVYSLLDPPKFGRIAKAVTSHFHENKILEVVSSEIRYETQDVEIQTSKDVIQNDNICTLCEEYAGEALDYLGRNKTQEEILEILHQSCSRLRSFKQQCLSLVDYYAPLFFQEASLIQPVEFCRKVNLCQQIVLLSTQFREDSCALCHRVVSEVLTKLKDPDSQLEIIEVLLKACKSTKDFEKKCKRMVFEYGPLILANAEQFLESKDICVALHACELPSANILEGEDKLHSDS